MKNLFSEFLLAALVLGCIASQAFAYSNPSRYFAFTLGTTSAQILAPGQTNIFLDINNDSATATIACAFNNPAVINGAGSITIPSLTHRSWENKFVPSDQINCISSAASTPITVGYN